MVELGPHAQQRTVDPHEPCGQLRGRPERGIVAELSKDCGHEFPPDDYEVPAGYDFDMPADYKSLTSEDIALATSAGAPSAAR